MRAVGESTTTAKSSWNEKVFPWATEGWSEVEWGAQPYRASPARCTHRCHSPVLPLLARWACTHRMRSCLRSHVDVCDYFDGPDAALHVDRLLSPVPIVGVCCAAGWRFRLASTAGGARTLPGVLQQPLGIANVLQKAARVCLIQLYQLRCQAALVFVAHACITRLPVKDTFVGRGWHPSRT